MKVINGDFFRLAEPLVLTQQEKLGFTIDTLKIVKMEDSNIGGCYIPETNEIILNISGLYKFRSKYEIKDLRKVAAAIILEECYHAANHNSICNEEELACWYGASEASKISNKLLDTYGNNLNNTQKKEKKAMILKDMGVTIVSGGMFDFVNKVRDIADAEQNTTYGSIKIASDANTSSVEVSTNIEKLTKLKKMLGNVSAASVEYAGMIYVYEKDEWKSYIDVDETQVVEIALQDTVTLNLSKMEGGELLEATAASE